MLKDSKMCNTKQLSYYEARLQEAKRNYEMPRDEMRMRDEDNKARDL
jgi:hypothetical protein